MVRMKSTVRPTSVAAAGGSSGEGDGSEERTISA
jgi:hypothetical protein